MNDSAAHAEQGARHRCFEIHAIRKTPRHGHAAHGLVGPVNCAVRTAGEMNQGVGKRRRNKGEATWPIIKAMTTQPA